MSGKASREKGAAHPEGVWYQHPPYARYNGGIGHGRNEQ